MKRRFCKQNSKELSIYDGNWKQKQGKAVTFVRSACAVHWYERPSSLVPGLQARFFFVLRKELE